MHMHTEEDGNKIEHFVPETCILKYCTLFVSSQHLSAVAHRERTAVWDTMTYRTGVFNALDGCLGDLAPQPDRGM